MFVINGISNKKGIKVKFLKKGENDINNYLKLTGAAIFKYIRSISTFL